MTFLPSRTAITLIAGLASLGVLAGCGSDNTGASQAAAEATAATAASATAETATATTDASATSSSATRPATTTAPALQEARAEILLLEGPQLDGQQFDLAATAGNDVLLWFWAPW